MIRASRYLFACVASTALCGAGCSKDEEEKPSFPLGTAHYPAKDPTAPAANGPGVVIAMSRVYAGDSDLEFKKDPDAWPRFGLDIDGFDSKVGDSNLCAPFEYGIPEDSQPDGPGGVDNSFGRNLISLMESVAPDPSKNITASIDRGEVTFMLSLPNLGDQKTQNGIKARLYAGAPRVPEGFDGSIFTDAGPEDSGIDAGPPCPACDPPKWDGNDEWPVVRETVKDGDIDKPNVTFDDSYMVNGTFVSSPIADLPMSVPVRGFVLDLLVHKAVVVADVTGSGADLRVTNGKITGVLDREEVIHALNKAAFGLALCGPVNLLEKPVRWRADMMNDGTQDSTQECNGISFGLGFEARPAKLGNIAPPAPDTGGVCD